MEYFVNFIVNIVNGLLTVLQLLMMVRAIMSWFVQEEGSRFYDFLYYATEPVIYPVRRVLHTLGLAGDGMMIDISFLVTVILLWVVQLLLPRI